MKTNFLSTRKLSIYSLFGLSALLLASCGSTQNSTHDNDGIYGGKAKTAQNQQTSDNKYKEYFSALNQENQEVFTDVENYSTQNDSVNKNTEEVTANNGWGANPSTTTVIVYDNYWGNNWAWNNWYGPSWGWGWNNWYGPSWGWGWNSWNYGWGWNNPYYYGNNWGWNNPYYGGYYPYGGYYNNHYYANGRRDTRNYYGGNGIGRYNNTSRGISGRTQSTVTPTRHDYSVTPRNTGTTRNYTTANPGTRTNTAVPPRNNTASPGTRGNTTPTVRSNSTDYPGTRPNTTTTPPTRSNTQTAPSRSDYTPSRSNDTPRSYTPSSSGGGNYGGGGGGGRSSGGGGGGRR